MKSYIYIPAADSVAGRVCAFFKRHPDEHLSSADIALKFHAQTSSVTGLLQRCFESKLLKRVPAGKGELIVAAGERLAATDIQAGPLTLPAFPAPGPAEKAAQRRARRALPPLDLDKLTVLTKAPPAKRTNGSRTEWPAMFARLRVGQAIEDLPAEYYGAAAKAAQVWARQHGAKFELRRLADGKCGIYRVQ